jgi:Rrf2 family transcriptional regulator, iron-sulfur cluster assembly transcription factor
MFSKATEYALRATIFIALKSSENCKTGIEEISSAIGSPRHFTAKILQILSKDHKIIHSVRGPNGGFYLTPKARKLSVSRVLRAMGEEGVLDKCVMGLKKCSETKPCPMHAQYATIRKQLIKLFKTKTIEEFALEMKDGVVFY